MCNDYDWILRPNSRGKSVADNNQHYYIKSLEFEVISSDLSRWSIFFGVAHR